MVELVDDHVGRQLGTSEGHDLRGKIKLSNDLLAPLQIGNVTLSTVDGPAGISMFAIYLSGDQTDVAVIGRSHICECFKTQDAGTVRLSEVKRFGRVEQSPQGGEIRIE